MTIPVVNKSVVTSGIYERHLTVDGKDYHHIFDSQTGYPVETELASLTIISDKSVDGENLDNSSLWRKTRFYPLASRKFGGYRSYPHR